MGKPCLPANTKRVLVAAVLGIVATATACLFGSTLKPTAGLQRFMKPVVLELSGESISVATGNLILKRKNLVIDTQLGQLAAGLVYNSADNVWRFGFDMTHDGQFFTDQTGTWYDLAPVTTGFEVTGSHWVAHGPNAVRTRGGLIHEFEGGVLERSYWNHFEYPRISYRSEQIANKRRVM